MAYSVTVADRINFGNMHLQILNITDAQSGGSTHKVGSTVWGVKAINNTASSDTFKEAVGAKSAASTRNQVTFTPVSDDDDGHAWVWFR